MFTLLVLLLVTFAHAQEAPYGAMPTTWPAPMLAPTTGSWTTPPAAAVPQNPTWPQSYSVPESSLGFEPWSWSWVPDGLMYKSYIAGEQEPRLSSAFLYPNDGEIYWDSVLGGRVGLLRFGNRDPVLSEGFQLDVEAGAFLRMQPQEERDVRSVDFRGGFPLTWREGPWQAKFGYYHISSHLGDEFQLKNPTFIRNNYSRDALIWGLGYFLTDAFRVYGELGWAFYLTGGAEPWEFQTGFDWANTGPTGPWGEPFLAANVHLWEETDWSGALNVLAGWQWRTDASDNTLRLGLQFYNGASNQKAFQHQTDEFLGLQLRYDF